MQRIIIDHFGPIEHLDLEIKDLTILIGPNAGGKSLVGKLVYFFKALPDDFFWYAHSPAWDGIDAETFLEKLIKQWAATFREAFGSKEFLRPSQTKLSFCFDLAGEKRIIFTSSPDFLVVAQFSESLQASISNYLSASQAQLRSQQDLWNEVNRAFGQPAVGRQFQRYLPPERSARNSTDMGHWFRSLYQSQEAESQYANGGWTHNRDKADFWRQLFENTHQLDRKFFSAEDIFLRIRQDEKLDQKSSEEVAATQQLLSILEKSLQGIFRVSSTGREYIEVGHGEEVRQISLEKMASGQSQLTGLWPALIEFVYTQTHGAFFFIDEPEAHLYPLAQPQVVNALALTLNATPGNQMLISTHSPYILTAFNNLLLAYKIGQHTELAEQVAQQVPREYWLDSSRVAAYHLGESDDGQELTSLMTEQGVIRADEIDDASDAIGDEFDALMNVYRKSTARGNA